MTKIRDWVDSCFSKELHNSPFKPAHSIHIIIYDKTNVPPPGARTVRDRVKSLLDPHQSLTFWWKTGGLLDRALQFADVVSGAANWKEALDAVEQAVAAHTQKTGHATTIASLQFWGHGSPGAAYMGSNSTPFTRVTLSPGGEFHAQAQRIAALMHPTQGHVWFRCCMPFQGEPGHALAQAACAAFGCIAVGHTFTIHALQSGTRILRPGHKPDWDTDEGIHKRGRRKGEEIISGPLRRRTITMFRLYPPLDEGEIILPAGLLALIERGISRIADDEE